MAHDPELDHLIYDGMAVSDGHTTIGSVRPTGNVSELPPLTPERLQDCLRVLKHLESINPKLLTDREREWADFVRFKIDDWNSDYDPPE